MTPAKALKKLNPADLVDMSTLHQQELAVIRMDYAHPDNLLFGEVIYKKAAKFWLYKDLALVVERAARDLAAQGLKLVLHDGLRTTDAQEKMLHTKRVQQNPHWLEEPRLLSPPGKGAHPRGMAIDVSLQTRAGETLDMGTPFDYLSENGSGPEHNPAHRAYVNVSQIAKTNRNILDQSMMRAAAEASVELVGLDTEWWDFRLPQSFYERFEPLSDADLPADMKMVK